MIIYIRDICISEVMIMNEKMKERAYKFMIMIILLIIGGLYIVDASRERDENGEYVHPDVIVTEYVDANGNIHGHGEIELR